MRHFKPLPHLRAFDPRPLSVLVCSRQEPLRQALQTAVESERGMQLHSAVDTPAEAAQLMRRETPDIVLLDIGTAAGGWERDIAKLTQITTTRSLPAAVLALSAFFDEEFLYALFAAGAKGCLLIEEWPNEVLSSVRRTIWGVPMLSQSVLDALAPPRSPDVDLDHDETLLLRMVSRGFTNAEIAYHLDLSAARLARRMSRLRRMVGVPDHRADLVAWAWRHGRM